MKEQLLNAGANWADAVRFFDRETEVEALRERVKNGTHTLLTAQRRMGKTSLVRELLRRLSKEGEVETVFVDLEDAYDAADAIAEIAFQIRPIRRVWSRIVSNLGNALREVRDQVEEVEVADLRVKNRSGIDAGSWQHRGIQVFEALTESEKPIVVAIDELPILVNRLLNGQEYIVTPERRHAADEFLSWLRKAGQNFRGRVTLIVSGSVGLEPILRQAGLSAHANIHQPFELPPWSEEVSIPCLEALSLTYELNVSNEVKLEMCRRLGSCIPHHVQLFFDYLHEHLRRDSRQNAEISDVKTVYERDLLGVRGQIDIEHYEGRLRMILGNEGYRIALNLLTEAATNDGFLTNHAVNLYSKMLLPAPSGEDISINDIMYTLEHDGYLTSQADGYQFISGLLQDWWLARHGRYFTPIADQ